MTWQKGRFLIATVVGPREVTGLVYAGLGLNVVLRGSPQGRRPPTWVLSHLGSGHAIATIRAPEDTALRIAAEIADAGCWEFDSLYGWKDRFPDAPERVAEIIERFPRIAERGAGGGMTRHEGVAREIAMARSA